VSALNLLPPIYPGLTEGVQKLEEVRIERVFKCSKSNAETERDAMQVGVRERKKQRCNLSFISDAMLIKCEGTKELKPIRKLKVTNCDQLIQYQQ